ncbi:hypothetical protein FHS34_006876 [Streptomyces echinatus]|uniref:Chorismate mutase n=1 Tax=Streptomyces echinatus TaxID=67293 RepID=A0A7W9UU78_9ACTN|nr:hypothetical protein [Streptomyces echinatus]
MRGRRVACQPAEKFLNFIIAEVIRHHERIAEDTNNERPAHDA